MFTRMVQRFFGEGTKVAVGMKDLLDKLEAYLGGSGLLAAFIWELVMLNASFNQLTKSPPLLAPFMIPVNAGIKAILGLNGLWWIVVGLCLVLNLTIVARKSKTAGILEIFLLWAILYEYTYGMKIPAGAWVLAVVSGILVLAYLVVLLLERKGHAVNPRVQRWLKGLSKIGTRVLILFAIFAITTLEARGVMIATLVPVALRAGDLWLHKN